MVESLMGSRPQFEAILNSIYEWSPEYKNCTIRSPVISPTFETGSEKQYTWRLICTRDLCAIHIVYLQLIDSKEYVTKTECTFYIVSRNNIIFQEHNITRHFHKGKYLKIFEIPSITTLNGHNIHISCKIFVSPLPHPLFLIPDTIYGSSPYRNLLNQSRWTPKMGLLELLISKKESADVKIITAEKKYLFTSKAVLSFYSSVFAAMFEHDMKEKKEDVVEMDDCKYEVVKEILRYMYFGEVENFETVAMELTRVSHRYELKGLVATCALFLFRTLSKENYIEVLILADTLQMEELKELTVNFILKLQNDTKLLLQAAEAS